MVDVADTGGLLLDFDLLIEVIRHAAKVSDHHFEVVDLLSLLVILKTLILMRINCFDHYCLKPLTPVTMFRWALNSSSKTVSLKTINLR